MTLPIKKYLTAVLAITVSAVTIALLLAAVDIRAVAGALGSARRGIIAVSCLLSLAVNILLGTAKWKRILAGLGCPISFRQALAIRSGCLPLKMIMPFKSHELLKVAYLARHKNISPARAAHSLLLDKALNLLALAAISLTGTLIAPIPIPKLIPLTALAGLSALIFFRRPYDELARSIGRLLPKYAHQIQELTSGLREIPTKEKIILTGYSGIYQFSEFLNTYLLMIAVGCLVPFSSILVFIPLVVLTSALPVTVLGMGTREALVLFLFSAYAPAPKLVSAGILVSLIEHLLPVVFGLFFIYPFIRDVSARRANNDTP